MLSPLNNSNVNLASKCFISPEVSQIASSVKASCAQTLYWISWSYEAWSLCESVIRAEVTLQS